MAQSFNLIPGQKLCWNCRKKLKNIEEENQCKSVGSRDKIGYEKRKLTKICDAAKEETWKSVACRQQQIFLNCHTYVHIFF